MFELQGGCDGSKLLLAPRKETIIHVKQGEKGGPICGFEW
jgi:hypothetical protein